MRLTRYEFAKIVGMRSLQLSEGEPSKVRVPIGKLANDFLFVAALELKMGMLDVCVKRGSQVIHVSSLSLPFELENLLQLRGGNVYDQLSSSSVSSAGSF